MAVGLPITGVMFSCCSCVIYLEYMSKEIPSSMNILTFAEFLFIAIEGFIFTTKFLTVRNKVPLREYFLTVVIFFLVNLINNQALSFHVPLPLHVIFRSGSLMANMFLGMWLLHKRYDWQKYFSVILITLGIIVCTLASAKTPDKAASEKAEKSYLGLPQSVEYLIGIGLLTTALFLSAFLGILQEKLYTKHGKYPREALFYTHALPLPFFLVFSKDIWNHVHIFNASAPHTVPYLGISMPVYWYYLIMSVITQYGCIRMVYVLTSECSSLTVTLVVTLRKFISLVISIIYFQNPFTVTHWAGAILVFGGTLLFTNTFGQIRDLLFAPRKKVDVAAKKKE